MSPVAIVTDSSAYLPVFETDWLPIHVIPLHLIWAGRTYIDGVDIQPEDFFRRLKSYPEMPRTSQISLQTFLDLYRRLLDEGNEILSIHISGRVSGTLNTAMQAARELAAGRIQVFDSMSGAAAMAFQVLGAARAAARGAALRECERIASLYADIPEMAQQLLDLVRQRLGSQIRETVLSTISPVLGAHIGPGAVGMAFSCSEE